MLVLAGRLFSFVAQVYFGGRASFGSVRCNRRGSAESVSKCRDPPEVLVVVSQSCWLWPLLLSLLLPPMTRWLLLGKHWRTRLLEVAFLLF
jgi:hypothetical protein